MSSKPEEIAPPSTWTTAWREWTLVLVLVLAANATMFACLRLFAAQVEPERHIVGTKWSMLARLSQRPSLVVLGDSSALHGIDDSVFAAHGFAPTLNLATMGNLLLVNDAWMLNDLIARDLAPPRVLLVHVFDIWDRTDKRMLGPLPYVPCPSGGCEARRPSLSLDSEDELLLQARRWVPLVSASESVLRYARYLLRDPRAALAGVQITPAGQVPLVKARPARVREEVARAHAQLVAAPDFAISSINEAALMTIIDSARKANTEVYFAPSPLCGGIGRDPAFQARWNGTVAFLEGLERDHPNFHLLLDEPMLFEESEMENCDHVVAQAAVRYSEALAKELRSFQ